MENFKNKINLNKGILEELKNRTYTGIKNRYAPLLLNVIIANNNFPDEIKDCILDHNMLEKILLDCDFNFLVNEFGKDILEFPEEFQKACIALYEEFQNDFPNANDIDLSVKNKVYGKNYRSPSNRFYYLLEFEEIKNQLREIMVELVSELGIVANLQPYHVYANCIDYEGRFKLRLEMYVRKKNKYAHVFESNPFTYPIDQVDLKLIEQYYEWLAISQKWGNEIEYIFIIGAGEEMQKYIPDFSLQYPVYEFMSSYKYYNPERI